MQRGAGVRCRATRQAGLVIGSTCSRHPAPPICHRSPCHLLHLPADPSVPCHHPAGPHLRLACHRRCCPGDRPHPAGGCHPAGEWVLRPCSLRQCLQPSCGVLPCLHGPLLVRSPILRVAACVLHAIVSRRAPPAHPSISRLQLDTEEDDGQLELQVDVAGSDAKVRCAVLRCAAVRCALLC